MNIKQTRTFAILELSPAAYEEIKGKLIDAGWQQAIMQEPGREVIDMHGIAVAAEKNDGLKPAVCIRAKSRNYFAGMNAQTVIREIHAILTFLERDLQSKNLMESRIVGADMKMVRDLADVEIVLSLSVEQGTNHEDDAR